MDNPSTYKFNRRRTRLPDYDYSQPGAYFVTICTYDHRHLFGSLSHGEVTLNEMGKIVWDIWNNLPEYYRYLELDEFMVMPDHVHAILILNDQSCLHTKREGRGPSPTIKRNTLPEIVRGFKSMTSRRINIFRSSPVTPVWQRSFYEHVIRNETDLADIRKYISENPLRWSLDTKSGGY